MRILILGINHQVQPAVIQSYSTNGAVQEFEREQKERFADLVRSRIKSEGIQLVAEEARHGQESIAERVCASEGCRYAIVEMLPEEREKRGIPSGYEERANVSQEDKIRWHREREQYMFEAIMTHTTGDSTVLLICGRYHVGSLAEIFREGGHETDVTDLLSQDWYVEDWMAKMLEL